MTKWASKNDLSRKSKKHLSDSKQPREKPRPKMKRPRDSRNAKSAWIIP